MTTTFSVEGRPVKDMPAPEPHHFYQDCHDCAAVCAVTLAAPVLCCAVLVLGVSKTVYDTVLH